MYTKNGKFLISILLGVGLSCIFRKSCEEKKCLVFKGPPAKDIDNTTYRFNEKCYRFKPTPVTCNPKKRKQVSFL